MAAKGRDFNMDRAEADVMGVLQPKVKSSASNARLGLEIFDSIIRECRIAGVEYISVTKLAEAVANIRSNNE